MSDPLAPLPAFGLLSDLSEPPRASTPARATPRPAPVPVGRARDETLKLISFLLDEECYAIPVDRAREVVRIDGLTRVPEAPEHVRGVQQHRGALLPVLEVKSRVGLAPARIGSESRIIVVEGHGRLLGLLVDAVLQIKPVLRSELRPPPPEVRTAASDYLLGMVAMSQRNALLLDLDEILVLPTSQGRL